MKNRFSFRFQTILDLKEKNEENRKAQLGTAAQAFQHESERLTEYLDKQSSLNDEFIERTQQVIKVKELQNLTSKLEFMRRQIDKQNHVVKECEDYMNQCRLQLIEAKKETKIFDKLKEKELENFNYMKLKEEELFVDQIVSYKIASK